MLLIVAQQERERKAHEAEADLLSGGNTAMSCSNVIGSTMYSGPGGGGGGSGSDSHGHLDSGMSERM